MIKRLKLPQMLKFLFNNIIREYRINKKVDVNVHMCTIIYLVHVTWDDNSNKVRAIPWIHFAPTSCFIKAGLVESADKVMEYLPALVTALNEVLPQQKF